MYVTLQTAVQPLWEWTESQIETVCTETTVKNQLNSERLMIIQLAPVAGERPSFTHIPVNIASGLWSCDVTVGRPWGSLRQRTAENNRRGRKMWGYFEALNHFTTSTISRRRLARFVTQEKTGAVFDSRVERKRRGERRKGDGGWGGGGHAAGRGQGGLYNMIRVSILYCI